MDLRTPTVGHFTLMQTLLVCLSCHLCTAWVRCAEVVGAEAATDAFDLRYERELGKLRVHWRSNKQMWRSCGEIRCLDVFSCSSPVLE